MNDFYADQKKRFKWRSPDGKLTYPVASFTGKERERAEASGLTLAEIPLMGDFRFYVCDSGVIAAELVEKKASCHGLIWRDGNAMRIIKPSPRREKVDKDSEIRYLRFAIINGKTGKEFEERHREIAAKRLAQKVLDFK